MTRALGPVRTDDPSPYLRTPRDHVDHYMEFCAPRWLGGPYMRWHGWARRCAKGPGHRRKVSVGRWTVEVLYSTWAWRPRLLQGDTLSAWGAGCEVKAVAWLPGKRALALLRE